MIESPYNLYTTWNKVVLAQLERDEHSVANEQTMRSDRL